MEINDATNGYTFTLFDKIDHHPAGDNQENTARSISTSLVMRATGW